MKKDLKKKVRSISQENSYERLLKFIDESPTPFHAVHQIKDLVLGKNSLELSETDEWKLERGTTYFVPRNDSSIAIFRLGNESPENSGFNGKLNSGILNVFKNTAFIGFSGFQFLLS